MATARPPRVIVLIETPKALKMRNVMMNESGIAVSVMAVVRKFSRNRKSTMITRMAPSLSAAITLWMDASMKFA